MTPHLVDLEALQKLLDRGAVRPWRVWGGPDLYTNVMSHGLRVARCDLDGDFRHPGAMANADLVVAAVNALPALIAEVRAGREALDEIVAQADKQKRLDMKGVYIVPELLGRLRAIASPSVPPTQDGRILIKDKIAFGEGFGGPLVAVRPQLGWCVGHLGAPGSTGEPHVQGVTCELWRPSDSAPPVPEEKAQEAVADTPAPLACYHCGQPLSGPAGCIHCKDHHRPAQEAGEETAAPKERIRARLRNHYLTGIQCDDHERRDRPTCSCSAVDLGWHPSVGAAVDAWITHALGEVIDPAAGAGRGIPQSTEATPGAVSQQPGTAPAPFDEALNTWAQVKIGTIVRQHFDAQSGEPWGLFVDALLEARRIGRGEGARNPSLASDNPRGAPPSAPALPKEEVAPDWPCPHGRNSWSSCPHCNGINSIRAGREPMGVVREQSTPAPQPLEEQLPKEGSAAAPAPGDAEALLREAHEYCLYMFERESLTGHMRATFAGHIFAILDRARASDATSAGGGE